MCISAGMMMALSTGVSMVGQLQQGRAQKAAANAQATQDQLAAAQQQEQAKEEAKRIRKAGERTQGAARAQMAASGIRVDSGSALLIDEQIGMDSEQDAMNTLLTGQRRSDASMFSASQARARGSNAQSASVLGALTTGLQGWKGVSSRNTVRRGHDTFAEGEY